MIRKTLTAALLAVTVVVGAQAIPAEAEPASAPTEAATAAHGFHYNTWDVCEYNAAAHGFYPDFYVWQVHSFHYGDAHVYQCWLASWDGQFAVCGQQTSTANGAWITYWDPYKYGSLAVVRCWN
jgi:hypothetical protein